MPNDFSLTELRIMQYLVTKQSYQDIADIIGAEVAIVAAYLSKFATDNDIATHQQCIDEKLKSKEWKQLQKRKAATEKESEHLREKEQKRLRRAAEYEAIQKRRHIEPVFATRQQDFSKMKSIRIDHRTVIFVKAGQDQDTVRKKYLQSKHDSIPVAPAAKHTVVSNFKPLK